MALTLPIKPELALSTPPPVEDEDGEWSFDGVVRGSGVRGDYAFEVKWDGHRLIAERSMNDVVQLWSRPGRVVTGEYMEVARGVHNQVAVPGTILDGEVVVMVDGRSNMQALAGRGQRLQQWRDDNMRYVVFDVLMAEGKDLTSVPYVERKKILHEIVGPRQASNVLVESEYILDGEAAWRMVVEHQLEGMIAKPLSSPYRQDSRQDWLKIKRNEVSTMWVVGYTAGLNARSGEFGALVLGESAARTTVDGTSESFLRFAGKCGTGFTATVLGQLYALMQTRIGSGHGRVPPDERAKATAASPGVKTTWLDQPFEIRVEHAERSADRILRHSSYKGLVEDGSAIPTGSVGGVTVSRVTPPAVLPPPAPRPRGVVVGTAAPVRPGGGAVTRPTAGATFDAPSSSGGTHTVVVKQSATGALYLSCPAPCGKFVWRGGSFKPCKHMSYVLDHQLLGNTLVDGHFQ